MSTLTAEKPSTIKSSKAPGDQELSVNAGEIFEIKLKEPPSGGFIWALANLPADFYLLDDHLVFCPPPQDSVRHFTFVGVKPRTEGTFVFDWVRLGEFKPGDTSIWLVKVK